MKRKSNLLLHTILTKNSQSLLLTQNNTTTVQPYSSFVQFVTHKILDGYEMLCKIANCYVC